MSTRMVKDEFWTDPYIEGLNIEEKLLFLYLLTNPLCNVAGAYEIRTQRVSFETGLSVETVEDTLKKFEKDKKIARIENWVFLLNFSKHQAKNPSVEKGIERILAQIPEKIKNDTGWDRVYTACIQGRGNYTLLNLTQPNLTQPNGACERVSKKIFETFQKISPSLEITNEPEALACLKLIEKYGEAEAENIAEIALSIQGKQYAPKITTPKMLWERIADLQVYLKREHSGEIVSV